MRAETLAQAYQTAIYRVAGVAFTLSEQPTQEVLFAGQRFAIITAYNPQSKLLPKEENLRRHRHLEREIQTLGLAYTLSLSTSPEGTWAGGVRGVRHRAGRGVGIGPKVRTAGGGMG